VVSERNAIGQSENKKVAREELQEKGFWGRHEIGISLNNVVILLIFARGAVGSFGGCGQKLAGGGENEEGWSGYTSGGSW